MTYYLTLFDGKKKSFEDVEHVFNSLYHEDCIITDGDGNTRTREEMKQTHAKKLAMASKCTLLLFRVITFDTIEIKYRIVNDEEDKVVYQLLTTNGDNRVVKARVMVEESLEKDVIVCEKLLGSKFPSSSPNKNKRESAEGDGKKQNEEEEEEVTKRRKLDD
mmetsp:Transcript_23142/g.35048  ORF Transcript_23142/g.35048 Transcript_23142/m.35048 type:complete len:162 (+) Transcript_23142:137-622(+)|eukprot:scaffold18679_cov97-Skeletonema_dohrnii-CCMP3373.AAC.2